MEKGLNENTTQEIIRIVTGRKPVEKIILFGSRATASRTERSDIDLAIAGTQWNDTDINLVKNELEALCRVPVTFDVVLLHAVTKESLRNAIAREGKVLYES